MTLSHLMLLGAIAILSAESATGFDKPECAARVHVHRSLSSFNDAAGIPGVAITFDDQEAETDLSGRTICGVRFDKVNAALIVVRGDETVTTEGFTNVASPSEFTLKSTSGSQLLSPGGNRLEPGPNAVIEDDDIIMTFDPPVAAFGFDHISQSADGNSFTHIEVFDAAGTLLHSGTVEIGPMWEGKRISSLEPFAEEHPGAPGEIVTADFWGIVSTQANIARIRIDERDDNNICPDSNIGLDTLRFAPAPCGLVGDVNGDGAVDRTDLNLVRSDLGKNSMSRDGDNFRWNPADLDRNGAVDANDLATVLDRFGP